MIIRFLIVIVSYCLIGGCLSQPPASKDGELLEYYRPDGSSSESSTTLTSLTLEELFNIPISTGSEQYRIHQSPDNKISENSIQFGAFIDTTDQPETSAEMIISADMAAEFINSNGGINGRRLVIIRADDEKNTPISAKLARRMTERYGVSAFIGPSTSGSVADVLQLVAIPNQIPLVTHWASAMRLLEIAGQHPFWRLTNNNEQQVKLITDFIKGRRGHEKILLVTGRDLYSQEIAAGVKKYFSRLPNGHVTHIQISSLVDLNTMDLKHEIRKAQQQGVTAILSTLINKQIESLMRKIESQWQGRYPIVVLGESLNPDYLVNTNLGKITQCIFTYSNLYKGNFPEIIRKTKSFIETDSTGYYGALTFDTVMLLAMGRIVSEEFNIPFKQAMEKIAGQGSRFEYLDYKNIISKFKEHGELSYYGYSGRIQLKDHGENLHNHQMYSIGKVDNPDLCH